MQDNRNFARGKADIESGELAICIETRQEQIQNQRKRTKKISAAAADFIIAGEQADLHEAKQAKGK
mgnify:CR=1 FL=1